MLIKLTAYPEGGPYLKLLTDKEALPEGKI